jgi:hypothetical protein
MLSAALVQELQRKAADSFETIDAGAAGSPRL